MDGNDSRTADLKNGIFDLGLGLAITPAVTETVLKSAVPNIEPLIISTPWHSYKLPAAHLIDLPITSSAWFQDGLIWQFCMARSDPEKTNWASWTDDGVRADKEIHDEWLGKHLGPLPYNFAWGKIESLIDWKGGFSSIIVSFSR